MSDRLLDVVLRPPDADHRGMARLPGARHQLALGRDTSLRPDLRARRIPPVCHGRKPTATYWDKRAGLETRRGRGARPTGLFMTIRGSQAHPDRHGVGAAPHHQQPDRRPPERDQRMGGRAWARFETRHRMKPGEFRGEPRSVRAKARRSSSPPLRSNRLMVRPSGFEPPTFCSGGKRSIQLSYGRTYNAVFSLYPKFRGGSVRLPASMVPDRWRSGSAASRSVRRSICFGPNRFGI